jgi:hypothetical protein
MEDNGQWRTKTKTTAEDSGYGDFETSMVMAMTEDGKHIILRNFLWYI